MKIAAITVEGAVDLHVRKYYAHDLAPFGAGWIATLAPDGSGRLVVDAEDGGPRVALYVSRGPGFSEHTDRILRFFADVDPAARQILTLRDGVTDKRLTCSLVLPYVSTRPAAEAQTLALAALFGASGPWDASVEQTFPAMAQVILAERPCVVTVRVHRDSEHRRVVGVADDVALCLGAALLKSGANAGGHVSDEGPPPPAQDGASGRTRAERRRRARAERRDERTRSRSGA